MRRITIGTATGPMWHDQRALRAHLKHAVEFIAKVNPLNRCQVLNKMAGVSLSNTVFFERPAILSKL